MVEGEFRRRAAARLLDEMAGDPSAVDRMAMRYPGRHDVRDALWWTAHPGSTTPSGSPDPSAELDALHRALYSRDGQASALVEIASPITGERVRIRDAEARILECRERLDRDAAAMDALLARSESPSVGGEAATGTAAATGATGATGATASVGGARVEGDAAIVGAVDSAAPAAATANTVAATDGAAAEGGAGDAAAEGGAGDGTGRVGALLDRARRARAAVPVLFASAGLVVGAALTWAVVAGGLGMDAAPLAASTGEPTAASGSPRALDVFRRASTETDRLPDEYFLGAPQVAGRLLYTDDTLRVWAYRDRGEVCLFLQDREAAAGTCTTEAMFAANGLTLPLPYHGVAMTNGADGTPAPALAELSWTPAGAIEIEAISVLH